MSRLSETVKVEYSVSVISSFTTSRKTSRGEVKDKLKEELSIHRGLEVTVHVRSKL